MRGIKTATEKAMPLAEDAREAVRQADGLIISAPGYHGSISGLVKNALDYLEDLAKDERPYLDGRAVGLIATAYGDQATMSTMQTLRSIVHALRGWPTPMGATIRTYPGLFSPDGECLDDRARMQLDMVGQQRQKARAQGGQGCRKGRRLRGDIAIDLSAHSAAFIWKPSSILSEGATG